MDRTALFSRKSQPPCIQLHCNPALARIQFPSRLCRAGRVMMMRIMVRTLRGDRVALDVDGGGATTVAQVKSMVMDRERVPVAMQRLFFAGCHLDDDHRTLAHYGVQSDSVLFLGLRLLRADAATATACQLETMHSLEMPSESMAAKHEQQQHHQVHVVHGHDGGGEELVEKAKRTPVSRRSLRKILSRLHVDAWTRQRDAKFLDLLLRHTAGRSASGGVRSVGELTGEEWSAIRAELNAATGSSFSVEELQQRLGEFRRELEAAGRLKSHPKFSYDARRHVVVATEADWKRYTLENPEAVAYEGRSSHLGRLRAIFSGDGGRRDAPGRESRVKRYLGKLLRSFGLHCKL